METFINRNGLKLEYSVTQGSIPFVFLHGLGGSALQIEKLYEPIDDVSLILLNQQGHGNSEYDYSNLSFDILADDVADLLDHFNIGQVYIAGISMGAAVALNFSLRYPERVRKALLIRNAWVDRPIRKEITDVYHDLAEALKNKDKEQFLQSPGYQHVKDISEYTRNSFLKPFGEEYNVRVYEKYTVIPELVPIRNIDDLKTINKPVEIIACRNDLCHPYEYGVTLHELIPGSHFTEVPDKDTDQETHERMINDVIRKMLK
ncbi:MAG: alpha/beta hydrolase [Erysipelotrichaceae bacterium]|nr:alpha/beta hydrolase [Erysipelotrichaceae bacterium]